MTSRPVSVLIADDHASVRAGLRLLLETAEDVVVVGEAADGEATLAQERTLRPDVVLMDARMPRLDGIEATRRIVAAGGADVLVLTTFDVDEVVFGALRAGAAGFLLKSAEPEEVIGAIRRVAAGDGVVAPAVTRRLLAAFVEGPGAEGTAGSGGAAGAGADSARSAAGSGTGAGSTGADVAVDPLPASLTPREVDVLAALGRGLSNVEIAEELTVSLATVKTHVSHVLEKTGSTGRMQAAVLARRAGLA